MPARIKPLKRKAARGVSRASETKDVRSSTLASRPIADLVKRLIKVMDILDANLGVPVWEGERSGLQVLVLTILSQNTSDPNALRGYIKLCETFPRAGTANALKDASRIPRLSNGTVDPVAIRLSQAADAFFEPDWAAVAASSPAKLRDAIRVAGLPNSKEPAIRGALTWVHEVTGGYRLEDAIAGLSHTEAAERMSCIKGIGAKTAAVTLIEAMGADLCPVDTHVHRIMNRLGIVATGDQRDKTYKLVQPMIPAGRAYALHHNLLTFGRTTCTAKAPKCPVCPLRKLCPSADMFG